MKPLHHVIIIISFIFLIFESITADTSTTSIIFTTLGRSRYAFDIFSLPLDTTGHELQLTDGNSVNFNGHFVNQNLITINPTVSNPIHIVYVTERNGSSSIFLDIVSVPVSDSHRTGTRSVLETESIRSSGSTRSVESRSTESTRSTGSNESDRSAKCRSTLSIESARSTRSNESDRSTGSARSTESNESARSTELTRSQHRLVGGSDGIISMKDRPSLVGDYLIHVSTHENTGVGRTSWAAVYSTQLSTGLTRRLSPERVADFSPAVSPSGVWTAVASSGEKGWGGEVEELDTDIYVFLTRDGSNRVKVVEHGGWPSWVDDSTFYFHRRGEDGWWSVYAASLPRDVSFNVDSVVTRRVTPPGLHSFTPAASLSKKNIIAVATRRPGSDYRHIELYDVVSGEFKELTRLVAPRANHYNPFISPDSSRVGYHKCRGAGNNRKMIKNDLFLENIKTHKPGISLFRVDGSFPSFSHDGSRIAYVGLPGLYVINSDGLGNREIDPDVSAFSTVWDPKRKGVVYTSVGPTFASEDTDVDILSIEVDADEPSFTKLTTGGQNNAFPSVSPDGKWVAFRSGRTGHKNLYIMNAIEGEKGGLTQLTNGPWSDTMCNWSPDGDWIAFASDRHNPGSGSFGLYLIHPNGTGLRHLIHSGSAGRTNHPWFSPDGKQIVFTSDYAAVSAEPISNPHHYQPYGEIFTINLDGSGLTRLTHNSYEDGTPSWGPKFMTPKNVEWSVDEEKCAFDDSTWLAISNRLVDAKIQCGG